MKILFVCHGNICRSAMAEFMMKDLVRKKGLQDHFTIASAATSSEEIGNPVYPPARRILASHGISCAGKTARRITQRDYQDYDLLIGMDRYNIMNMKRMYNNDPDGKIRMLLSYAGRDDEVSDPWYTDDFETCYNDIEEGLQGLLELLEQQEVY